MYCNNAFKSLRTSIILNQRKKFSTMHPNNEKTANQKRGLLIVFQGLDRSGKSTQSKLLSKYIQNQLGQKVLNMSFPDRETVIGKSISQYLKNGISLNDEAIHLLFSANRWERKDDIINTLNNGTHIVCDRYAFSGVVYSAAKGVGTIQQHSLQVQSLDWNWCKLPDKGLPTPDIVFYIQTPIEVISDRSGFGDEKYEKLQFMMKVQEKYSQFEQQKQNMPYWWSIDGNQSINQIKDHVFEKVRSLVEEKVDNKINMTLFDQN